MVGPFGSYQEAMENWPNRNGLFEAVPIDGEWWLIELW